MIATAAHDRRRLDPAHASMRPASGRPGLSRDEEIELAARIARGDRQARNRMVQANLGLVVTIARDFLGRGLDLDDLIGEGNLGLIRAAEEFDPRFGTRFSTYASYWIKQAIRHALINTTATIRLPAHMVGLLTKWRRAERSLCREAGPGAELRRDRGVPGAERGPEGPGGPGTHAGRLRLEGSYGDGTGGRLVAEATDRHGPAEERLEAEDERAAVRRLMGRLDDRERAVLMLALRPGGRDPDAQGDRPPTGRDPGMGAQDRGPRRPQARRPAARQSCWCPPPWRSVQRPWVRDHIGRVPLFVDDEDQESPPVGPRRSALRR